MAGEEHTIELDGGPLFYRSAPSSSAVPPLYLHGAPLSSDCWIDFIERTGGIAPDLPGFGRTSKAGHLEYTLPAHADFVARLLDELDTPRVALVGHGWGAGVGLTFAERHPEQVDSLVLINALPLLAEFRWSRLARILRTPGLGELVMGSTTRGLLARTLRTADTWSDAALAGVWEQFDQGTQRAVLRVLRSVDERGLAAAGLELDALEMPTLVIWGERDPWLDPALADGYGERLAHAEVVKLAGAGHWPWHDDASVVELVGAFLAAH